MTDLLGLLSGLHTAITQLGELHISISDVPEGLAGEVDHDTLTIHLRPGLDMATGLKLLADGVATLLGQDAPGQVAVGGGELAATVPAERHLRVVR